MGIHDRDWYREGPARRQKSASPNFFHVVLGLVVVVALVVAFVRSLVPSRVRAPEPATVVLRYPESPPAGQARTVQSESPMVPRMGTAPVAETFRCVLNGQVIYEGPADCRDWPQMRGNVESARSAPPTAQRVDSGSVSSDLIYLCTAYSGGMFWTSAPCSQQSALLDRTVRVPPNLPWEQKVALGEAARAQARALIAPPTQPAVVQQQPTGPSKQAECAALEATIKNLDSQARQSHSGQMQDWIKQQRQQARDRQFRLRC